MINLNVQRSKQIKFGVEISGVQLQDIKGAVRIMHEGIEYGFPIKILDDKIFVEIPPLENVIISELKDSEYMNAKLEVIAGDVYLTPWEDNIKIEKPIKVEATIQEVEDIDNDVQEKTKPDMKANILSELDLDIKIPKRKSKIFEKKKKEPKNKSRFTKMMEKD